VQKELPNRRDKDLRKEKTAWGKKNDSRRGSKGGLVKTTRRRTPFYFFGAGGLGGWGVENCWTGEKKDLKKVTKNVKPKTKKG